MKNNDKMEIKERYYQVIAKQVRNLDWKQG